jgi:tetratricopeptide (TPR) repeat protein
VFITLIGLWRRSAVGFVGAWVFAILAPTSLIPMIAEMAAERRMYLPLAGIVALILVGAYEAAARLIKSKQLPITLTLAVSCTIAFVLGIVCVHRLSVYKSRLTLWQDTVKHQPNSPLAQVNYGVELVNIGQGPEALPHFERALELKPNFDAAETNLANELRREHKPREALTHYENVLQHEPNYAIAHNDMGLALIDLNRSAEAISHFQRAIQLDPQYLYAYLNLANAYIAGRDFSDALNSLNKAIELVRPTGNTNLIDSIQGNITYCHRMLGDSIVH